MTPDDIAKLFTHNGNYAFSRWSRPIAPVIFGLTDESQQVFRDVIRAVIQHSGHPMTDADPEMGANFMVFFVNDWAELDGIPELEQLTGQYGLVGALRERQADRYRLRRYEQDGSIRACLSFVRMGGAMAGAHPAVVAEHVAVNAMLNFAAEVTPSKPLAALIRAAYDPVLPAVATDASHALRLFARMGDA